jgi:hypothetical protein
MKSGAKRLVQMVLCSNTALLPLWPCEKPQVAAVPYGSVKLVLPILFRGQKRGIQPKGCIDNEEWCQKVGSNGLMLKNCLTTPMAFCEKPQVAAVPYGSVKLVLPILFRGQKR